MSRRRAHLLAVFGATALAVGLGVTPVTAEPTTWTVDNPNADGSFAMADGALILRNTTIGDVITCPAPAPADSGGVLESGTYDDGSWSQSGGFFWADHFRCTDAHGADITVLYNYNWYIAPEAYEPATGRTTGEIFDGNAFFLPLYVVRPGCEYAVRVDGANVSEADFT